MCIRDSVHCCEYIRYANTDMNLEHRADYLMKFLCEFDALKLLLRAVSYTHLSAAEIYSRGMPYIVECPYEGSDIEALDGTTSTSTCLLYTSRCV